MPREGAYDPLVRALLGGLVVSCLVVPVGAQVTYHDVTGEVGITFVHESGATGEKYLPETLGAGGLFLDVDADGWQDVLLVNSTRWTSGGGPSSLALYRNDGDGTFTEATAGSGLEVELYGIGARPPTTTTMVTWTSTSPLWAGTGCSGSRQRDVHRRDDRDGRG